MAERKYSIAEIDRMRIAVRRRFPMTYLSYPGCYGGPMTLTDEFDAKVEDQLRTFMLNGTDPDELDGGKPRDLETFGPSITNLAATSNA